MGTFTDCLTKLSDGWPVCPYPWKLQQCISNQGVADSTWAAEEGQDFVADHNSSNVDFATIHCWPDNWKVGMRNVCKGAKAGHERVCIQALMRLFMRPNQEPATAGSTEADVEKGLVENIMVYPVGNGGSALPAQVLDPEFQRTWINTHEMDARHVLQKPVTKSPTGKKSCSPFPAW